MPDVTPPPWTTLTDAELREWVMATAEAETDFRRSDAVGPLTGLYEVTSLSQIRAFDVAIRPIVANIDPEVATGFYLRLHGLFASASYRATGRAAKGVATVTSATGGRVRAGAVIVAGGQSFTADADVRLTAAAREPVAFTAAVAGAAGNVASGTAAAWGPGVVDAGQARADAVVTLEAQWITIYGFDPDNLTTDAGTEAYRRRVIAGYALRGETATEARYRAAAFGVPGVTNARTRRAPRGRNSADVGVLVDRRLPTEAELDLVRAALGEVGIVGGDILVGGPLVTTVAVTVEITGTPTETQVEDAIAAWFRGRIGIGDGLRVQDLYREATAGLDADLSINYLSPVANIAATAFTWIQPSIQVTRV